VLDAPSVSSTHCEIVSGGDGFHLRDLGSTNGTRVNGEPVKDSLLFRNDAIQLGDIPALFTGDDVPERPAAAAAEEPLPLPSRPAITLTSAASGPRPAVCPPDFKRRRDVRLIWAGVIVALLLLIAWAAREFVRSNFR